MIIGEDENGERARAKVEVIADMPPEPPPVMEVRSELLVDEGRLVVICVFRRSSRVQGFY